ncbi:MAG: TetR/AcrR family transcriptional regulator [Micrococcales bacterium]|nr:TetR/AcrR family transcriptional regulator [Micrococcales bacterium]
MSKSFSEHEQQAIQADLIEACKQCWSRYGYQKTGIRELAALANISTGAFYRFYDSKELLFVATADEYQRELIDVFHRTMATCPGKRGVALAIKAIVSAMSRMAWLTSMWDEWPIIVRKLPRDYLEQDFHRDVIRIDEIIAQYGLTPKRDIESTTQIVDLLMTAVARQSYLPGDARESADFIIDAVVDALFE